MTPVGYRYSPLGDGNQLTSTELNRLGLRNAFGQILIVSTPDLSSSSLLGVTEFLSSQPELLFANPDNTRIGGGGCPLVVEAAGETLLSDRSFWTLVCGSVDDPLLLVERFVRSVINSPASHPDQMNDRQTGHVAEDALYAFFDTCLFALWDLESTIDDQVLCGFADLFYDYLLICDLEHEARQDPYITQVLEMLQRQSDTLRFCRLAAYRIGHGQFHSGDRPDEVRQWLGHGRLLRLIVDEELANLTGKTGPLDLGCSDCLDTDADTIGWHLADLIAITYGSAPEADAVYDYILAAGGPDVRSHVAEGSSDTSIAWADQQRLLARADTGFHTTEFSADDASWSWLPTSEQV